MCTFHTVVHSLSRVRLFVTPWAAARQASLSFPISRSLLKLMSIKSVMPSNHLVLCHPLLLLPLVFPSQRRAFVDQPLNVRGTQETGWHIEVRPSSTLPLRPPLTKSEHISSLSSQRGRNGSDFSWVLVGYSTGHTSWRKSNSFHTEFAF